MRSPRFPKALILAGVVTWLLLLSCRSGPTDNDLDVRGLLVKVVRIDWNAEQIVVEPMSHIPGLTPTSGLMFDVYKSGALLGVVRVVSVAANGSLLKLTFLDEAVRLQMAELVAALNFLECRQHEEDTMTRDVPNAGS